MTIEEITVHQLRVLMDTPGVRVVDVREPAEFHEEHVPGTVSIPLRTVPQQLDAFLVASPTYVLCRAGGRSAQACDYLAAQGAHVVNVRGGILAWVESGFELAHGET
ncbi:MAG TPA: rhodanese-like domain-containing protein [Ilumatobacter sp.]